MDGSPKTTSYSVTGLGVAVSALGWSLLPSLWGAGILGFGAAHVVLGLIDTQRPVVRNNSRHFNENENMDEADIQ